MKTKSDQLQIKKQQENGVKWLQREQQLNIFWFFLIVT